MSKKTKVVVMAEGITPKELKKLRKQIDKSMLDPNYSIVTNYEFKVMEIPVKVNG